jgi:hypothetical protein
MLGSKTIVEFYDLSEATLDEDSYGPYLDGTPKYGDGDPVLTPYFRAAMSEIPVVGDSFHLQDTEHIDGKHVVTRQMDGVVKWRSWCITNHRMGIDHVKIELITEVKITDIKQEAR